MDERSATDANNETYGSAVVGELFSGHQPGRQTDLRPWKKGATGRPPKSAEPYAVNTVTGCWEWLRAKNHRGYGLAWNGARMVPAHVLVWERTNGPIAHGLQLDHLCRNRGCVNPEHLEPVTGAENTRRGLVAKLNHDQVEEIRRRAAGGEKFKALSASFGVSSRHIGRIVSGERWGRPASGVPVYVRGER